MKFRLLLSAILVLCLTRQVEASPLLIEAEGFSDLGGWVVDQQFMDQMGSPYLLAHGLGEPVADATTEVAFPARGKYRLWVRTKDWVAPWKVQGAPGTFQVVIGDKIVPVLFGVEGADWHWQDGGAVEIAGTKCLVKLHDLTGFEGRCDALLFSPDLAYVPPADRKSMTSMKTASDVGCFDLVVVGGGIAGSCAAVKAARLGLTVALVQDRPVLGGNGSSEVRVWPEGEIKLQPYPHVGEIVAELVPKKKAGTGNARDGQIYADEQKMAVVRAETNITLFLNYRVNKVEADKKSLRAVLGDDIRSGKRIRVRGRWFADCTGDGAVGFLSGADYEMTPTRHMGSSNLWNLKDAGAPESFPRCSWALDMSKVKFPGRPAAGAPAGKPMLSSLGGWFWESGFDRDPVADMELVRDLNLRAMYGAWDTLKNVDGLYPNYKLNWAAYIAGKRESRRLLGDVILSGDDFRNAQQFPDGCFPCSWDIDLHLPNAKYQKGFEGNEFISAASFGGYPKPYWVPYRCLYSRNVTNLFMAGRDISVTHEALGPVRVMRTCGMMGEVVGMAASLCKKHDATPRIVYEKYLDELKELLRGGGK